MLLKIEVKESEGNGLGYEPVITAADNSFAAGAIGETPEVAIRRLFLVISRQDSERLPRPTILNHQIQDGAHE